MLAFSLAEALRNLGYNEMFLVSVSGVGWMGIQLAVSAFLAKRLAAVVALDPVTSGLSRCSTRLSPSSETTRVNCFTVN